MEKVILVLVLLSSLIFAVEPQETKTIKEKKIYPMGKKIFKVKCQQDLDLSQYVDRNALKKEMLEKKLCGSLKQKHLHALLSYLWEVKRLEKEKKEVEYKIVVKEGEKCPVCGMFTYKYPKWVAQIYYSHEGVEHHHSFDGVKDMMKFYFDPLEWGDYPHSVKDNITKILVSDYYSQKAIDAKKAFYVLGSDVYGPMGNELIPFKERYDAEVFSMDHQGRKIIRFDEIVADQVYALDQ